MNINTVIFDLDGTLLDTIADIADSINETLRRAGCPERSYAEVRSFVGNGLRRTLALAFTDGVEHPDFEEHLSFLISHYEKNCLHKTAPYPGVLELMEKLRLDGCRLGIVSNKTDPAVKELQALFFSELVPVAIGERPGIRRKPAPDSVLEAMRELGAEAARCVYVGDSEVDIQTAANAGIPCISVLWGYRDRERLENSGASAMAARPEGVYDLIQAM